MKDLAVGGFGTTGLSGVINPHIKSVERVSDTQVKWTIQDEYSTQYIVTVTATIPSGDDTKRVNPVITIARVNNL